MAEKDLNRQEPVLNSRSEELMRDQVQHYPASFQNLEEMTDKSLEYLAETSRSIVNSEKEIEELCSHIRTAGAIHLYGFGRSGTAALACAIRLRQFCDYLPAVWWIGDQVRMPILENDLLILFSKDGSRSELASVAYQAAKNGAKIVLVTAHRNSRVSALARLKILLPLSNQPFVYGGGDFELAAFFFQEILVTYLGKKLCVPKESVWRNHV